MQANTTKAPAAIRVDLAAIFVSLELSRSKWLVTSLSPGGGERMSRHIVSGGDIPGLLDHFSELQRKAEVRTGQSFRVISIQEAGLDGFWIHRVLEREGIESYVVDPASIATSRRRRRAKTDRIDGEVLVRALLAYNRGEPRVCAMLRVPTPEEEDRRRLVRERKALTNERIRHVNRIKGLLFSQGVSGYEPLKGDRRKCLDALTTGDGRALPPALIAQISRELDRIELLIQQIKDVEEARDALLVAANEPTPALLLSLKGIGPEFAAVLWCEGLSRKFDNDRLPPTPVWCQRPGKVGRLIASRGSRSPATPGSGRHLSRLRGSGCAINPIPRSVSGSGRESPRMVAEKTAIIALARKLLVALWKYVNAGVVIEGALLTKSSA